MNPDHQTVLAHASALSQIHIRARKPAILKRRLAIELTQLGWYVRARFLVPSRGLEDHYRGALDLVCWPPPLPDPRYSENDPKYLNTHISHRPPPILIDLDRYRVCLKTRAKMAAFTYPVTARVVILTQADEAEECQGIDTIVCLGA